MAKFQFSNPNSDNVFISGELKYPEFRHYNVDCVIYDKKEDIPKIDIKEWAEFHGLKISEDGKTLTCYKTVRKSKDQYFSIYNRNFEYKIGEFISSDKFNNSQFEECSHGLHAASMRAAIAYSESYRCYSGAKTTLLELKVDISDPDNFVIPYSTIIFDMFGESNMDHETLYLTRGNKIRFKRCFVVREVKVRKVYVDEETGEQYDG